MSDNQNVDSAPAPSLTPADPAFWDAKYGGADFLYGTRPNAFVTGQAWRLPPGGRVLMAGDGEGRNGVWLAEQGHRVVSVDFSPRALQKATRLALDRGVRLTTICADLTDWDWPEGTYDAAVAIFLHVMPAARRPVHRAMLHAVRPGGLVLVEGFAPDQLRYGTGGPKDPSMLHPAEALADDFAGAEILELEEAVVTLGEGPGHQGPAAVTRLAARRTNGA
jgi:SAM-dependent methyltransferase